MRRPFPLAGLPGIALWLAATLAFPSAAALAAGHGEPGPVQAYRVDLRDRPVDLQLFHDLDLDVDGVFQDWARIYLLEEEANDLRALGYRLSVLPESYPGPQPLATGPAATPRTIPAAYHTYATLTSELQSVAAAFPGITRLSSIGRSVQNRELWMMKITDNPDVQEDEPEVAYIAAMHGDEVVGKELLVGLIHYLTDNYGTDQRVTDLVNDYEIWLMPSMNPDGTELHQRYNANNFDLNREFPDQFDDPVNTTVGRPAEVQAVMQWGAAHSLSLVANFHGGALVANYPFDSNPAGSNVFSPTPIPDHPMFVSISRTYADNNPPMSVNNSEQAFDDGICNGADWYSIRGGMQDWAYVWYGTVELTIEQSNVKWPAASTLPGFWDENLESMLAYLERAQQGVRGLVTDAVTGLPVPATIHIDGNAFPVYSDPDVGDYHRVVLAGNYTLHVSAENYVSQSIPISVASGPAARYDVALEPFPTDLEPVETAIADGPGGNELLDPGETVDLAVTLGNFGRVATGVTARLEPTTWFTEVTRADASYPDIATGQSAESAAPSYEIWLDPAVPQGYRVGYALRWETDDASGTSEPFFLIPGGATCMQAAATDVPRSIPDNGNTVSQITVTPAVAVESLEIPINISHPNIGDLRVELRNPSNVTVVLHNRTGGTANNILGTYGKDLTSAEPLSNLYGSSSSGAWQLTVRDQAVVNSGMLNAWSLRACGPPPAASTPEMRFRDFSRDGSGVHLSWWPYPLLTSYRVYRATDLASAASFLDVTASDPNATDTTYVDAAPSGAIVYYVVTGIGPAGEGPKGVFGQ